MASAVARFCVRIVLIAIIAALGYFLHAVLLSSEGLDHPAPSEQLFTEKTKISMSPIQEHLVVRNDSPEVVHREVIEGANLALRFRQIENTTKEIPLAQNDKLDIHHHKHHESHFIRENEKTYVLNASHPLVNGKILINHRPLSSYHAHCHIQSDTVSNCLFAQMKSIDATKDELLRALIAEDENSLVRHISIKLINTNITNLNLAFDEFILTRPWWVIREEPFDWQLKAHKDEEDVDSHGQLKMHEISVSYAALSRMKFELEGRLKHLANIQYTSEEECKKTPLAVGYLRDNGWASMMALYGYARRRYTILNPYISDGNSPSEDTIFSPASFCPEERNKWLCAFLPPSNCSFPSVLTNCTDKNCMQQVLGTSVSSSSIWFSSASKEGYLINPNEQMQDKYNRPISEYHSSLDSQFDQFKGFDIRKAIQFDANGIQRERAPDTYWMLLNYGLMWRHNWKMRSEIEKIIEEVRGKQREAFTPAYQCTAIHIRRGDRTLGDGVNMTDYCEKIIRKEGDDKEKCMNENTGREIRCAEVQDLGCFNKVPFGALTLKDYLEKAYLVNPTKNIFLMTDATPQWLEGQMRDASIAGYNIFTLPAVDRSKPTQGINFFASVAIARRCGALVGNWMSGVSMLVHEAMCVSHSNVLGECPPTYDVGNVHPQWILNEPEPKK